MENSLVLFCKYFRTGLLISFKFTMMMTTTMSTEEIVRCLCEPVGSSLGPPNLVISPSCFILSLCLLCVFVPASVYLPFN